VEVTNQSLQNSINVARINAAATSGGESGLSAEEIVIASRRYGNHLGVEFGAAYSSSAVVPDGTHPPPVEDGYSDYVQSATPGCRAPHVWLGRPDEELSTLDLIGTALTLLTGLNGDAWRTAAADAARALGLPIDGHVVGGPGLHDRGGFCLACGCKATAPCSPALTDTWRSATGPADAEAARGPRQILVDETCRCPR
jgi:hypothetical protein